MRSLLTSRLPGLEVSRSAEDFLNASSPGIGAFLRFFSTWFKLDVAHLVVLIFIAGQLNRAQRETQYFASKTYRWILKFFVASVSISSRDRLNREVSHWLMVNVASKKKSRFMRARTEAQHKPWGYPMDIAQQSSKRLPVHYFPDTRTLWFFFERRLFMIRGHLCVTAPPRPGHDRRGAHTYFSVPEDEFNGNTLHIMCAGRSVEPIKRFLEACRKFGDKNEDNFVSVCASNEFHDSWGSCVYRPLRTLHTVHFNETAKNDLLADIANYLEGTTRRFYVSRGIPYRRGYLLHGPPGTGKTSLSLALAGHFSLELYLLHVPSVRSDQDLERLFSTLPSHCIILVEDIDAVGIQRQPAITSTRDGDDDDLDSVYSQWGAPALPSPERGRTLSGCTLSGLLNVLDGVASQEGRIVLMTCNHADKLDKALIRPGRIDRMLYLGNISPESAKQMFLRMYAPDVEACLSADDVTGGLSSPELEDHADAFSRHIPDGKLSPALVQGYLLNHCNAPQQALAGVAGWVESETNKLETEEKEIKLRATWKKSYSRRRRTRRLSM